MQILTTRQRVISILKLNLDTILLYSVYVLAFTIPAFFGKPQLLIGSIINFLIVFTVLKYGFKRSIPVQILPSSSALVTGLLFSGATPFMVYLIPFIIVSNSLLALTLNKRKDMLGVVLGSLFKSIFLYSIVNILMNVIGLPSIFLTSMGYIQFITALIGGTTAILVYASINRDRKY